MRTQYIKNFPNDSYQKILNHFIKMAGERTPIWSGTINIGAQKIYVECHIPELAKQIPDWFVSTTENAAKDDTIPQLYLFDGDASELLNRPANCDHCMVFCDDKISGLPDIIAAHNFTFIRDTKCVFYQCLNYDTNPDIRLMLSERNHLLKHLIQCALKNTDTFMFHGAAVGCGDYGVMLSGVSGAGKSTLAAMCIKHGLDYVGDDRIAITKTNNSIIANPIYTTISLENNIFEFPVHFIDANTAKKKNLYRFNNDFQFRQNLPIRAVISPIKTNNALPRIIPGNKSTVISRITADYMNLIGLLYSSTPLLDKARIDKLFTNCEFYDFELGPDISENSEFLYNFITKRMKNVHQE